jgi:hypothetical protein
MRINPNTPIRRKLDYSVDQRRPNEGAALDDDAERIELPVCLRKESRRKAEFVDLAEAPDPGVVRRLDLHEQATKASKRQPARLAASASDHTPYATAAGAQFWNIASDGSPGAPRVKG